MSILSLFKSQENIGGQIAYYNLTEWWLGTFDKQERNHIVKNFQPLGGSDDSLIKGNIQYSTGSAVSLLSSLAGWFKNIRDREIGYKLLEKAESLICSKNRYIRHTFFLSK